MSTVSGETSVLPNPTPRRTRPGLTGRRLVLLCGNEHRLPPFTKQQITPGLTQCSECGTTSRKWVFLCAPLWQEGLEWIFHFARGLFGCFDKERNR